MPLDPVPYFTGGGAEHSAANVRGAYYDATKGGNGVVRPTDMNVKAVPVPTTYVEIYPGSATVVNRYPGGDGQSYRILNTSLEPVEIPPTDSTGGATRYVIVRVDDPEFEGQPPADVANGPYCRPDVISSLESQNYPHVVLARIDQPASTGTIEPYMITDLREVANPLEHVEKIARPNVGGDTGLTLNATGATGEWFPNDGGNQDVPIPEWATYAQITAHWINIEYDASVNPYGAYWVEYGPYVGPGDRERKTQEFGFNHFVAAGKIRGNWILGDTVYIPKAYRGTVQKFIFKARYDGADKGVHMDAYSGVILDIRFVEVKDQVD